MTETIDSRAAQNVVQTAAESVATATPAADSPACCGGVSRRAVSIGAAGVLGAASVALLSACSGGDAGGSGAGGENGAAGAGGTGSGADGGPLAEVPVADVPVGGGVVIASVPLVVTQPTEGTFAAFGGTCPHQGCPVTRVDKGVIVCPCHTSHFDVATGAVVAGPAPSGLPVLTATVTGDQVVVTGA